MNITVNINKAFISTKNKIKIWAKQSTAMIMFWGHVINRICEVHHYTRIITNKLKNSLIYKNIVKNMSTQQCLLLFFLLTSLPSLNYFGTE